MRISVIVPARGNLAALEACLSAISRAEPRPFEVIVVDDASKQDLRPLVERYGHVHVRLNVHGGPARARNVGARLARGDVLFFVDSDVVIPPDSMARVQTAFHDPSVNVFQGIASKTPVNRGFGPALLALKWYFMLHKHREASFVYSHVFAIRKPFFEETGGFNETFKPPGFGEEFELGARLRRLTTIHVDPAFQVGHAFQGVAARTCSVFHRAYNWARVFSTTGTFEQENASARESAGGLAALLSLSFVVLGVLACPWFFLLAACFIAIHAGTVAPFIRYVAGEKGAAFAFRALIPNMVWVMAATLGGATFLFKQAFGIEALVARGVFKSVGFRFSRVPSHLVLFVTARCNASCQHCFYWKSLNNEPVMELTINEMNKLSRSLGLVEMLTLSGGEPTLRPDLYDIVKAFYVNSRTRHVTLHTNGMDPARLTRAVDRCARCLPGLEMNVSISVDGTPRTHDRLRGVPGAFKLALASVDEMIRLKHRLGNVSVTVNTCFNASNALEIERLGRWFLSNRDVDNVYVALVRGDCKDPRLKDVDIDEYARVVRAINEVKARRGGYRGFTLSSFRNVVDLLAPVDVVRATKRGRTVYPCKAGRSVLVVSERGDVFPCEMLGRGLGNLREHGLDAKALLRTGRARTLFASIQGGACWCTWECAVMSNLIFSPRAMPRLVLSWIKYLSRRTLGGG